MSEQVQELEDLPITEIEGVGKVTAKKLQEKGITTVHDLYIQEEHELAQDCNISRETANRYITGARTLLQQKGIVQNDWVTATQVLDKRLTFLRCSTGSSTLDNLLGDGLGNVGIETGAITEFSGEFGSGKSQICHTLCVNAQLPIEQQGLNCEVLIIDTEGTFRPERVKQIAQYKGLDTTTILDKVRLCKAHNASHLELIVKDIHHQIHNFKSKLVIIDSIIALHRAEFAGRGTLADRQQRLNSILHKLVKISELHNVAVIITNQVSANPDQNFPGAPANKPVGGNIVGHTSTYRVALRKSGKNRIATMVDSPSHPYGEARFTVDERGVVDVEE